MYRTRNPDPIVVGYSVAVRDEETVLQHLQSTPKSEEQWLKTACWFKATGTVTGVFAFDLRRQQAFKTSDESQTAGLEFVQWVLSSYPRAFPPYPRGVDRAVAFYGFSCKHLLRIAGMDAIRAGAQVPLSLWYQNEDCLDPQEMLCEAGEARKHITLAKLLAEAPGGPIWVPDGFTPFQSPEEDCRVAMELCLKYMLIAPPDSELEKVLAVNSAEDSEPDESLEEPPPNVRRRKKRKRAAERA